MTRSSGRPARARPGRARRARGAPSVSHGERLADFVAELLDGHTGPAVLVPFDPQDAWGAPPQKIANPVYGQSSGHRVTGTMNGHPFDGWIGRRWGSFFLLVDAALRRAAGIAVGDQVRVVIGPAASPAATPRRAGRARERQ